MKRANLLLEAARAAEDEAERAEVSKRIDTFGAAPQLIAVPLYLAACAAAVALALVASGVMP